MVRNETAQEQNHPQMPSQPSTRAPGWDFFMQPKKQRRRGTLWKSQCCISTGLKECAWQLCRPCRDSVRLPTSPSTPPSAACWA